MKKILLWILVLLPISIYAHKSTTTGHKLAGNLLSYPYTETIPPSQTPAPEGYVPFHLEHYGRHGSRWLLGADDYLVPIKNLEKAEKAGKLTPLGEKTLNALREIEKASHGRLGELSDKGARQHYTIGKRMAQNYPEIFTPDADLTAKSTTVIRCIISMAYALEGIQSEVQGVNFDKDASEADMWFMNYDDKPGWRVKDSVSAVMLPPYRDSLLTHCDYLTALVSDAEFAKDSVSPGLMPRLYWVLANAQSHTGQPWLLEEVFSEEELEEMWKSGNAGWFLHGGNSQLTKGRMPFVQRNLLDRIINRTDSAIKSDNPSANLRFGHDGILVSIITLMELGGYGEEINTLQELEKSDWKDYDIIPMAGNVQLVFYRTEDKPDDILVKAMVNEKEVTMPGEAVTGPYYKWNELRDYYISKLQKMSE